MLCCFCHRARSVTRLATLNDVCAAWYALACDVNAQACAIEVPASILDFLLSHVACPPVNATTKAGLTPLHVAAQNGRVDLVNMLLVRGADPSVLTIKGEVCAVSIRQLHLSL